jgi:DNA replication protein DnaC
MLRELACHNCGRSFSVDVVTVKGHQFPSSRLCDVCREAERASEVQQRADIRFSQAGVPAHLEQASFASFERASGTVEALRLAEDWAKRFRTGPRPRRGLFFHGPPGSGKTHLAAAIVREAVYNASDVKCLFLNVPQWLNEIRDTYSRDDRAEPPSPQGHELLVLDDIGIEHSTTWSRDQIYRVVNEREENGRLTIVTSNCDHSDLRARLGSAIVSRLIRLTYEVVLNPAEDFRVRLARDADAA